MAALWLAVTAGCQTNPAPPSTVDISDRLRPGDRVTVRFTGVTNPPQGFDGRIKDDGMITLPLVSRVEAAGKTPGQLEEHIHSLYVPEFFTRLTVNVLAENRFVYISGMVRNPGPVVYTGELTVLKAIAAAGDFTNFADKDNVQLTRSTGQVYTVDCDAALNKPSLDPQVSPGDQIYVPRRLY